MRTLGELLIADGICTLQQIQDAVQSQVILGGRIGTNLIELGAIDEKTLVTYLSRQYGVHGVHGEVEPDIEALALMKASDVSRLMLIPFRKENKKLYLVTVDPRNLLALDEAAFITGLSPVPLLVAEIRFWALLQKYYGIEPQLRYVSLRHCDLAVPGVPGQKPGTASDAKAPGPAGQGDELMTEDAFSTLYHRPDGAHGVRAVAAGPVEPMPILEETDLEEIAEFQTEMGADEDFLIGAPPPDSLFPLIEEPRSALTPTPRAQPSASPAPVPAAHPQPVAPPAPVPRAPVLEEERAPVDETALTFAAATQLLQEVGDREAIARCVLRFSKTVFRRTMLWTIHRGMALGWDSIGLKISRREFHKIAFPLDGPSIFQLVEQSRGHYLGKLAKTPTNVRFLALTGKEIPRTVFAVPILVNERVVNILYGDNGHKEHCGSDTADLLILAQNIARSYSTLFNSKWKEPKVLSTPEPAPAKPQAGEKPMVERREFIRIQADAEVKIRPVAEGELRRGQGMNISGGGILLTSSARFEPGTILDLEVITPTHRMFSHVFKPLQARCRVIRVDGEKPPYTIAAEFLQPDQRK